MLFILQHVSAHHMCHHQGVFVVYCTQSWIYKLLIIRCTVPLLTFRHRASSILGQAFRYSPENAFYIFNQQIYFII